MLMKQYYDIIGDIHGHADELKALLGAMGYRLINGCYQHPERKALFLGDFIDRGPQQREVLNTVMDMVDHGGALAVMGNHEFNGLSYHTEHPDRPGTWLRPRDNKNTQQHLAFLQEYLGPKREMELERVLQFFRSLPLFLEFDGFRVVHACWQDRIIRALKPLLGPGNTLTHALLVESSKRGSPIFEAVELLLKGPEVELPGDHHFFDKDGHARYKTRTQWWLDSAKTFGEITMPAGVLSEEVAQIRVDDDVLIGYPKEAKPVFLGHYWLKGHPEKLADNVACLDYSVAKDGKLVAYRWSGESVLNNDHFFHI